MEYVLYMECIYIMCVCIYMVCIIYGVYLWCINGTYISIWCNWCVYICVYTYVMYIYVGYMCTWWVCIYRGNIYLCGICIMYRCIWWASILYAVCIMYTQKHTHMHTPYILYGYIWMVMVCVYI